MQDESPASWRGFFLAAQARIEASYQLSVKSLQAYEADKARLEERHVQERQALQDVIEAEKARADDLRGQLGEKQRNLAEIQRERDRTERDIARLQAELAKGASGRDASKELARLQAELNALGEGKCNDRGYQDRRNANIQYRMSGAASP